MSLDNLRISSTAIEIVPPNIGTAGSPINGAFAVGRSCSFAPGVVTGAGGGAYCPTAPSQQTIVDSATISHNGCGAANVTAAAARTAVILQAGTVQNQTLDIFNVQAAANTITFAAAGTSNVADGVSTVMAGLRAYRFIWDVTTARWYRAG